MPTETLEAVFRSRTPRSSRLNAGIGGWAGMRALASPHRTAVIDGELKITYRELLDRSTAVAGQLEQRGIGKGDRVAFAGRNSADFVFVMVATHLLGAVFVPLNFRLAPREFEYILTHSGASALVFAAADAAVVRETAVSRHLADRGTLAVIGHPEPGESDFTEWAQAPVSEYFDVPVEMSTPAFILYTSGTTGRPKGVVLTHENIYWNSLNLFATLDVTSDEVAMVSSPLFHVAGLTQTLLPILLKGATAVLMPAWDTDQCFDLIEAHQVTWMFGVPTMYAAMQQSPRWDDTKLPSVRLLTAAGAPVPPALIEAYQRRGFLFCQGYGLTETAPGATFLEAHASRDKVGSAGMALPFTRVRCVRPDGTDVEPGERGEVVVKGPNLMAGYWEDPEATHQTTDGQGWFHTGDIATVDDDGFLFIVDRLKDMFISGGENVYPSEVEAALYEHPGIRDAAVIGIPHDKWGEVGKAYVTAASPDSIEPGELRVFLTSRLAKYKIPVEFVLVDDLPKTGSGKVRKETLRQW